MDTASDHRAITARATVRDHQRLRDTLSVIDRQGWNGPEGRALLHFVRRDLVRPLVFSHGLRGAAARQAEATGWDVAWTELVDPRLRTADSPWGVVWTRVRRAIAGEVLADRYCVTTQRAWQIYRDFGVRRADQWRTFEESIDLDRELVALRAEADVAPLTSSVIDALASVGWDRALVVELVESIVDRGASGRWRRGDLSGARRLGAELGIPQWQAHRVMTLMLGTRGWPGLVERLATDGGEVLQDPAMIAALRATVRAWSKSPVYESRAASRRAGLSTLRHVS
jgi:hypothetical protein